MADETNESIPAPEPKASLPGKRLVALLGGGDWTDASVDHVVMLTDTPLGELYAQHEAWYRDVYLAQNRSVTYLSFSGWLIAYGHAIAATDDDVTTFGY